MCKEKQIDEKHELSESIYMSGHGLDRKDSDDIAEQLYHEGYRKQREARYKTDWINVTEKNPEDVYGIDREKISVLVCTKSGKVSESTRCAAYKLDKQKLQYVRTGDFYWSGSKNVTHWMPMPLPPHKSDPEQEELPL